MKTVLNLIFLFAVSYFFTGCAHKISIAPETDEIVSIEPKNKQNINVAYYISQPKRIKSVITPGGGGDKVEYTPYKDTENVFRLTLLKIFNKVYALDSLDNKEMIDEKNIKYIFIPSIFTTSYSDSLLTWPPTKFTFELRCYAVDNKNNEVWSDIIYSEGYATFSQFKSNFGLSAQRATSKAFLQLMESIDKSNKFNYKVIKND